MDVEKNLNSQLETRLLESRAGDRVGHLGIFPGAHSPWGAHGGPWGPIGGNFFLVLKKGKIENFWTEKRIFRLTLTLCGPSGVVSLFY